MNTGTNNSKPSYLIVNADDFGYYSCVSEGILHAHRDGIVTATGVFGNSPDLTSDVGLLQETPTLDVGVHLNMTFGGPLTDSMRDKLADRNGQFPSKFGLLKMLMTRKIRPADIHDEWAAQIQRCVDAGVHVRFVNSHEHVHMFPGLTKVVRQLADRFDIGHVRIPSPDPIRFWKPGTLIRDIGLSILGWNKRNRHYRSGIGFLGMGESGRLSLAYLRRQLTNLRPGGIFELMCHPGNFDSAEIGDSDLTRYHDWELERDVLTSPEAGEILRRHNVRLIGFRDIENLQHA